jgi:hypothetical protein
MNHDDVKFWIDEAPQLIALAALAWVTFIRLRHVNATVDAHSRHLEAHDKHNVSQDRHLRAHDKHNVGQDRHLLVHDVALGLRPPEDMTHIREGS